jgi:hypothetical protein
LFALCLSASVWACGAGSDGKQAPRKAAEATVSTAAAPQAATTCERRDFPTSLPIAEASGAVYLPASATHGERVVIVGDSGTEGQLVEIAASDGAVLRETTLPLDPDASDDLEGFTRIGERYYGLTSGGYMREWERTGDGDYELRSPAYPIAPPGKGDPELTCKHSRRVNCGPNYEGLCLRDEDVPDGGCLGFAASKTHGALFCLVRDERGRLRVDGTRRIQVTKAGALSGCHYTGGGDELWAGTNLFGANTVYRVTGTSDPASAQISEIGRLGPGFCEAIALAPDGRMFRFSDSGLSPSFCESFTCR